MSDLDPKIIGKIKKCLALSKSPNPNEAAIAMRQAQALMEKHGVNASQVTMSEIGESSSDIRTMARDKPALWEVRLAAAVGKAFGCELLVGRNTLPKECRRVINEGRFIFIGLKSQAEIAAYTTSVLSRKCKSARQAWVSSITGSRQNKTRLGDAFAEGWVIQIQQLVTEFANPPEVEQAIQDYKEGQKTGEDAPVRGLKNIGSKEILAARLGMDAAKGESLYRPMSRQEQRAALGMG